MMCEFQNSWKHLRWPVWPACSPSGGMLADDLSLYILFPVTQSPSHNQLLAHPHQERLLRVVEDASPRGPEAAGVSGLQEPVPLLEQEVVADQLILHLLRHPCHNTTEGLNEFSR